MDSRRPSSRSLADEALPTALTTPDGAARLRARVIAHPTLRERIGFDTNGVASVGFGDKRLSSGFHIIADPIRNAPRQVLGSRAMLRVEDAAGVSIPPARFFDTFERDGDLIDVDRLSRAVHVVNFFTNASSAGLLFLSVSPRLLKSIRYDHGRYFADLLLSLGLNPASIVIEIPAVAAAHRTFLSYLVDSYRRYGFKVAAQLASAGGILALQAGKAPQFVLIDAEQALREAMVAPLLAYAARSGVCPIFTGVADPAMLAMLREYGVGFVDSGEVAERAQS